MKKIYYLLSFLSFFLISLSSEGSGRIDLGFGLTAFATTKITGSEIAILAMQNNKLSTGNFKNKNAVQLFVKYDKDFLDFLGARAGLSYKMVRKRADPKYTYNSDDGNFDRPFPTCEIFLSPPIDQELYQLTMS